MAWLVDLLPDWMLRADAPAEKLLLMALAVVLFVAVMGLVLLVAEKVRRLPAWAVAALFLGPAVLMMAFGLVWPAVETVRTSFHDRTGRNYVGLDNYAQAFTQDEFQIVLRNTAVWVFVVPVVATFIGLVYAVLVDRTRFERLAKTLVFLPMSISMVGASIIWRFVYEYRPVLENVPAENQPAQVGLINQFLVWIGLQPQQFLIDPPLNTLFLLVVMVWIQAGFAMTVLSAAIKAIPDDIVEAARLDGLGGLRMFRYITVPSIRPALVVVLTTIAMGTLKVFDIVRTMTGGNFETSVVAFEFYRQSFTQRNAGLGAALAVILFVLVIPIIAYNVRQLRQAEEIR